MRHLVKSRVAMVVGVALAFTSCTGPPQTPIERSSERDPNTISAVSRPAVPHDTPPEADQDLVRRVSLNVVADSWRWLGNLDGLRVYAVKASDNQLCVLLTQGGGAGTATCGDGGEVGTNPLLIRYKSAGSRLDFVFGLFVDDVVEVALKGGTPACRMRGNIVFITHPPAAALTLIAVSDDGSRQEFEVPAADSEEHTQPTSPGCS
jgi:hypothetical protein